MWTQILSWTLLVWLATRALADDQQEYIAKFRESCRRESVVVQGKRIPVAEAVPLWLQSLDGKSEQESQEAARNLAIAAIAGQLPSSRELVDSLQKKYDNVLLTNDVCWEIKLNLLSALSEIGDPELKNVLEREIKKGDPRLARIARLVESKQYLLPTVTSGGDVQAFIRGQLGKSEVGGNQVIFQEHLVPKEMAIKKMVEIYSGTNAQAIQQALDDWGRNPQMIKDTDAFEAVKGLFRRADDLKISEAERAALKEQIVILIGVSGDGRTVEFLREALQDKSDDVRRRAERALQQISPDK